MDALAEYVGAAAFANKPLGDKRNGGQCPSYGEPHGLKPILRDAVGEAVVKGAGRLLEFAGGDTMTASPIGLYFAELWYFEDLYPLVFAVSALEKVRKMSALGEGHAAV